jgi:hypothetical protein
MTNIVPKGPRANVSSLATARKRVRGRPSGLGYDPEASEEYASPTLEQHGADPDTDVFALVGQRGYSEDRFYTKSTNQQNHSKELRVALPQGLDAQVYGVVRDVPEYRSLQDFFRDAIVHRLEYLQKRYRISESGRRLLELERLRADSDRRSADIDTMTEAVSDLGVKLTKAWEAQDYAVLVEELEEGAELLDWLRQPYRGQVERLLDEWKGRARDKIKERMESREE